MAHLLRPTKVISVCLLVVDRIGSLLGRVLRPSRSARLLRTRHVEKPKSVFPRDDIQ
jgi:hypothetical protein